MVRKQWVYILVVLGISILCMGFSGTLAAVQESFVLDLDSPVFNYSENALNDSSVTVENVYNGSENITYWVSIPKNSTMVNATFNVTGKIVPVYEKSIISNGLIGMSIGNATSNIDNEISVGTQGNDGTVRLLYGVNGTWIWNSSISTNSQIFSTDIGNVTSDTGDEIAAGSSNDSIYLLDSSGTVLWIKDTGGDVKSVKIADLYEDGTNEVIAVSDKVYVLNLTGDENWSVTVSGCTSMNEIAVGNVTSDSGNEIVVGCNGGKVYILNATGDVVNNVTIGASAINSVGIGNITSDAGNEIAIGSSDSLIYILNSTGGQVWNYSTGDSVNSVKIGDVTTEYSGNEVVCGSNDMKVYTLDNDGSLIWDFEADSYINTIATGNLTIDSGNEVAAGAGNGYLYTFNFDYFPTNLSIDVGATGGYDWNISGKLRDTRTAWGFESEIQSFLDSCTEDASGFCNVSFVFHSDYQGKLNISGINVTYRYNTSAVVSYQNVSNWSRTSGIQVNESVGNQVRRMVFSANPSYDMDVRYIKINSTATSCDFNGSSYSTATVDGYRVCDIPMITIPNSGTLPGPFTLWDNNMSTDVPVYMNEDSPYNTTGLDDYYWRKNFTLYNLTGFPIYLRNVTGNVSLNDVTVKGTEFLRVYQSAGGSSCDITPSSASADCDSGSPTYYPSTCFSVTHWVCKKDTNSDGVSDYFDFRQGVFDANTTYQVGGERNLNANLSSQAVTPGSDIWGRYFNYSVLVNDTDGDMANITIWTRTNLSSSWVSRGEVNITSIENAYFNISSDSSWVGLNSYKFEYQDFNASGDPIHSTQNTSVYSGPDVQKHNTSSEYSQGNESNVARGENITLVVRINDTNESSWVGSGVSCRFWITTNGTQFDSGHDNVTNSSGHCVYIFNPDSSYSTGNQTWKAGVRSDTYYLDMNSSDFIVTVNGRVNVTLLLPQQNQMLRRNSSNYFLARLYDEYGVSVNASGYNCSFYFNDTYLNSSDTNATGWCNYSWSPACGVSLGRFNVSVNLSGSGSELYSIWGNQHNASINMTDELNTTVTNPSDGSIYHKGNSFSLNSTTNDTCMLSSAGDFAANWSKKWKNEFKINFNETDGINRTREPFILNGTQLEALGIDLTDWVINYTVVMAGGLEVPADIKTWNDSSKTTLNESLVYMNNYSELVFLLDLDAYQSRTYWIYYNQSNPYSDYNLSYILNGGFENNDTSGWSYSESANCMVAGIDRCKGYAIDEGTEPTGNHSLYLYSECTTIGCNTVEMTRDMTTQARSNYIKIGYKSWGEFNTASGAYLSMEAGNVTYNMSVTPAISYAAAQWNHSVFSSPYFQSASNITIRIHDVLDSGGGMGASHVYVDYVCIANSSDDCVTMVSGTSNTNTPISQTAIGSGDNMTWDIPLDEDLGKRRLLANASGNYYMFGQDWVDVIIYGWAEMPSGNISSDHCVYNQTYICMQNATLTMYCNVTDANSSLGIENYNVSFYGDESYLGSNLTNSSGIASWTWTNSSDVLGQHNITCNITDYAPLYYNSTPADNITVDFNISSGNTTADVLQTPIEENATDITRSYNHTFNLNMIVNNTGNGTMYGVDVNISVPAGIVASDVICPVIKEGLYCNVTSQVSVTYHALPGNRTINVTVTWSNADSTAGNASNQTSVIVINKTVLNTLETWINYTIARGDTRNIGNFTVEAFGNTEIIDITFSEEGGNYSDINQWILYDPVNISTIARESDQLVLVNMSIPSNTTVGVYLANITANATGSSCSPTSDCWDYLILNLTVAVADWERTPNNISKTIGLVSINGTIGSVTVTNNKANNYTFNITLAGNGTPYIKTAASSFNLTSMGSHVINVYHNTSSTYPPGYWFVNLSMTNLDGAFPTELNTSVFLNVINMTVNIIYPNATNQTSAINASDIVNITANATLSGALITSSMVWTVEIGGESCTGAQSSYNSGGGYWDINCTAPLIAGNPLNNSLTVTGNYTAMVGTVVSDTKTDAVLYDDITPPQFSAIEVTSANYYDSDPWIMFSVVVTDNGGVDSVWSNVTYDSTTTTLNYSTESSGNYTFNFTNPNNITDYDIIIFANDTNSGLQNSTTGWFDVFKPLQFTGNSLDPNSGNQTVNFTFYREATGYTIHSFGTNSSYGEYNHTIHKRNYDMLVSFSSQQIMFNGVNSTLSAEYQHNESNPGNLTNPVRFDIFPNASSEDISNIDLPDTAENILMAVVVESPNLNYTNKTITIDYTSALSGGTYQEGDLRIFYCSAWSFAGRACGVSQEFSHFNESIVPNVTSNIFTFTVNSSSTAYAIAESCYPNTCGYTPPATPGGPGGSPSPGGSATPSTDPVCGNGACETGENELNCPADCLEYAFDVKTDVGNEIYLKMFPGENKTYSFTIANKLNKAIITFLSLQGLKDYITLEKDVVAIKSAGNETIDVYVALPDDIDPGFYKTTLSVTSEGGTMDVPVTLEVSLAGRNLLSMDVDLLTPTVSIGGGLRFKVDMKNLGYKRDFNINMTYMVKNSDTEQTVKSQTEDVDIKDVLTFTRTLSLEGLDIEPGQYFLEVWADFDGFSVKDVDGFEIIEFSLLEMFFSVIPWVILILVLVTFGYFARLRYIKWKLGRVRYPLPMDLDKIPGKTDTSFWLGNIADTNKRAWYNPNDLTTHILIAGSTGSGKSVGASVIVEEAMDKNIPVVVFDPTAQWTGFVKACIDENVLRCYPKFRMDKRYTKPYKGMIFEIESPHLDLDFKKYMNPGEITVFTMNKLKPGEYDVAVKNIIDSVFRVKWEESTELRMIIIFDEVHRLLEKYGGIGGYTSLEQACREFRKWGIGVIMCSQVLADFKEAIAGNVLTDIQLNTKSLVDIGKVKEKYGPVYAQRVSRQGIGVGMIQHPRYNDGKPWFVNFRPPYHNPHKISNEEMEMYKEFAAKLESIDARLAAMKKEGKDVFDIELEVKLAKDKLKQGRFRMAKIYIESLEKYFR